MTDAPVRLCEMLLHIQMDVGLVADHISRQVGRVSVILKGSERQSG
jgi:hypothetical protein